MPQVKVQKKRDFTQIENATIQDPNLSLKSKGLLIYMLSLPEDWDYTISGLSAKCKEGKASIRSAISELMEAGYIMRRLARGEKGTLDGYEYIVYETPQPSCENCTTVETDTSPSCGFPTSENPSSGNCTQQIKNLTKEESNKDNPPISPQGGRRRRTGEHYKPKAFESLYAYYPRHVGKAAAQKAWDKLRPSPEIMEAICVALRVQKAYWLATQTPKDKIPHLSTWLNGQRWTDDPDDYIPPDAVEQGGGSGGWAPDPEVM